MLVRHCVVYWVLGVSIGLLLAACGPVQTATVIEITSPPLEVTPRVIYVTPTNAPTSIPTFSVATQTPLPTRQPAATATTDQSQLRSACRALLTQRYTTATEFCLGEPDGFFCNGGAPPRAEPTGPINSAMALQGSLVEVDVVDAVQTAPLLSDDGGGMLWLRVRDTLNWTGLLFGDVTVRDVTLADANFPAWQSLVVQTDFQAQPCAGVPQDSFVLQANYGEIAQVVINGVSVTLRGTLHVQTSTSSTNFIMLEGISQLRIFGQALEVYAGQQVRVPYAEGDFARPLASVLQTAVEPLAYDVIENFPVTLLDRPVLLPQPGFATVNGNVNMRSDPGENARILFILNQDEPLSVLGQNAAESWYHVRLGNGETGWVRSDLLSTSLGTIQASYDATPQPPQRFGIDTQSAIVITASGGNLRRGPDTSFPIMRTIPEGTTVSLLERSPYSSWVKVQAGADEGWMALITLETEAIISFLPQDYDAPLPPRPTATPNLSFGGGHAYPDPRGGQ